MKKSNFLQNIVNNNVKKEDPDTDQAGHPSPDLPPLPPSPGGFFSLTEEILEDALVRVLQSDPAKALGPAIAFLDKKKGLSVEDQDTTPGLIALDKLHSKRRDMFV